MQTRHAHTPIPKVRPTKSPHADTPIYVFMYTNPCVGHCTSSSVFGVCT